MQEREVAHGVVEEEGSLGAGVERVVPKGRFHPAGLDDVREVHFVVPFFEHRGGEFWVDDFGGDPEDSGGGHCCVNGPGLELVGDESLSMVG